MRVNKILIMGGSGLLGSNWALKMRGQSEVTLGLHNNPINIEGVDSVYFNFSNLDNVNFKIKTLKPDIIINAIGATNVDLCESNLNYADYLNVYIPSIIARLSKENDSKFIHISTDHLFSGTHSFYSEKSLVSPLNVYGKSKYSGEKKVLELNSKSLIVRTNFFGWGTQKRKSFSDWILDSLRSNSKINVFDDVFFTPIIIDRLVDIVTQLALCDISGVVNVVGSERVSKYDFACRLAHTFNLPNHLIIPAKLCNSSLIAPRPLDMSLSSKLVQDILKRDIGDLSIDFKMLLEQELNGLHLELLK